MTSGDPMIMQNGAERVIIQISHRAAAGSLCCILGGREVTLPGGFGRGWENKRTALARAINNSAFSTETFYTRAEALLEDRGMTRVPM